MGDAFSVPFILSCYRSHFRGPVHSDFAVSRLIISNVTNNSTFRLSSFQNLKSITIRLNLRLSILRLQSSPYICVFKCARVVKQKVWNEVENRERDWGETLKIRLSRGRLRLACFARVRLLRHAFHYVFYSFWEKNPTVLQFSPSVPSFVFAVLFIPNYINTNEIPGELSRENMLFSHVKISPLLWLHNESRLSQEKTVSLKWFGISLVFI